MIDELVSIVVPIYNVEKYVGRCIESIIQQTYKKLEIILVNDGSNDQSYAIITKYAKKDERIVIVNKQNGGLSDARNEGIRHSHGEYLVFIDSDDYIHQQYVEVLYSKAKIYQADIVVCEGVRVNNNKIGNKEKKIEDNYKTTVCAPIDAMKLWYNSDFKNPTVAWNKLYNAKLFKNERFDYGKLHEDEFIMHRLFMNANKVVYLWLELYFYYQRRNSITAESNDVFNLKRLDIIEALENRLNIFLTLKDDKLLRLHVQQYLDVLLNLSVSIRGASNIGKVEKDKILLLLKEKLIFLEKKYCISVKHYLKTKLYFFSPPLYSRFYLIIRRIKNGYYLFK